jgi:ABC-type dipeptide/oligopeptide/nickel transport system permease component
VEIVRRLLRTLAVLWLAVTLAFFALRILPGDALQTQLIQSGASAATVAQRRAALGLDQPVLTQYVDFLAGLARGDLGVSLLDGRPVNEIIAQQALPTITLALSALLIAVLIGTLLGIASAVERRGWLAQIARRTLDVALSVPLYWSGTLVIFVFAVFLDVLPSSGAGDVRHLLLPAVLLGFHTAGAIGQMVRSSISQTLGADFVRYARAKGLPEHLVIGRHVLRASLAPVISVTALQAGFLLSGVVITESLFVRPGLGRVLLDATLQQNYPVVQGIVIWSALVYALANGAADILIALIDPRVKGSA